MALLPPRRPSPAPGGSPASFADIVATLRVAANLCQQQQAHGAPVSPGARAHALSRPDPSLAFLHVLRR